MSTRSTLLLAGILIVAAARPAGGQERAWPYFRSPGVVVRPGDPLPPGLSLVHASIELRLAKKDARVTVVDREGQTLVHASIKRPAGTHVVIAWGESLPHYQPWVYVNGRQMPWDERSRAAGKEPDPQRWEKSPPASIRLEGATDELRVYPYAMTEPELANAFARAAGRDMTPLAPLDVRFDYRMSIGQMNAVVTIRAHFGKATAAKVVFQGPRQAHEATTQRCEGGAGVASCAVGELSAGKYPVSVTVLDRQGQPLEQGRFEFERIELPWLHNAPRCDTVPPPFTPVKVEGPKVSCVLRDYTIGDMGLPDSIVVKGKEILASPVVLELAVGGRAAEVRAEQPVAFGRTDGVGTTWRAAGSGGGLKIVSDATFEFDGMVRYELTVTPAAAPVHVDGLALAVPLAAEHGDKIHALPIGGNFRDYEVSRQLPAKDGVVWESQTGFPRGDHKPTVGSFVPMVWLGGIVRGLCYFADNDKGWVPSDRHPAVTVTRRGGAMTLRLHFISEPLLLEKPRKIIFALVATPTKPLPEDYRVWGRGDTQKHPLVAGRIFSCDSFAPWKTMPRQEAFDVFPKDYDFAFAAKCAKEQRGSGGKYAPGQPRNMYQDKPWGRTGRDGLYFDWEWKAAGVRRSPLVWSSPSLVDCRAWYWDQYLEHGVYDGIYLDDAFPTPNYNWETCSAYLLPDGRVQPGASFFGFREYLKRVWCLFHAHGKRPIITVHMTATLAMPALTFATSIYDGEDTNRMGKYDFLDVWPMERLHVLDNPERTGLVTMFMFKGSYADKYGKDPLSQSKIYRSVWTGWLLHDLWYGGASTTLRDQQGKPRKILGILSKYAGQETIFHPYYQSGNVPGVKSLLDAPLARDRLPKTWMRSYWSEAYLDDLSIRPLKASVYQRPESLLVVVGNYAYVPVRGEVKLDFKALGVAPGKVVAARIADVDDWPIREPADEVTWAGGTIACTVPPHSFRLFELTW